MAVQPQRQLGGGGNGYLTAVAAAMQQWQQRGGSGSSLAAAAAAEALQCQLGVVVVGTKGVKPTDTPTEAPTPHKKVSWQDALFPRRPLVDVDS